MDRPWWWSLLQELRPVQHVLSQEIREALDREFERSDAAHRAAVKQLGDAHEELRQSMSRLERNNAVLAQRAVAAERRDAESRRDNAGLRKENEYLRSRNAELTRANDVLRRRAAGVNARRWQEILAPGNVPARPRERPSPSEGECDVFACLDCGSFLVLEIPAVGEPVFHRPVGEGCDTCTDLPCARPPEQPVVEPPAVVEVDLTVPGTSREREQLAAELVAGLVKNPPLDVAADAYAKKAAELTRELAETVAPTQSSSLDAIATGLDKVSDTVKSGVVWCATELLGMPDFLGTVLGHVVSELVTDPLRLKDVSRAIRVVDTIACAVDGDLGRCASLRHLAIMDLGQAEVADQLKEAVKDLSEPAVTELLEEALEEALKEAEALHEPEEPEPVRKPDRWFTPEPPEIDPPWRREPETGLFGF